MEARTTEMGKKFDKHFYSEEDNDWPKKSPSYSKASRKKQKQSFRKQIEEYGDAYY